MLINVLLLSKEKARKTISIVIKLPVLISDNEYFQQNFYGLCDNMHHFADTLTLQPPFSSCSPQTGFQKSVKLYGLMRQVFPVSCTYL